MFIDAVSLRGTRMKLRDELLLWENEYGDRIALKYLMDNVIVQISYRQFVHMVFELAERLQKDNHQKIAIIGENSIGWMCYFYAGLLAGKQTLLCDMLLPTEEMCEVLKRTDTEQVFLSEGLCGLEDELGEKVSCRFSFFQKLETKHNMLESLSDSQEGTIICMTSGTTSRAKGVRISVSSFLNNNVFLSEVIVDAGKEQLCMVYSSLPMHHMYGVNKTFTFLHKGATLCLGSMRTILKDIISFKPNVLLVVPTVVEFLEKRKGFITEIEAIVVSGCKCEKKIEDICRAHNIFLQNIYGSSESAGGMALNLFGDSIEELSVIPGRKILIAEDGEICIQTKWLMDGYYNDEQATEEKMSGDILYTGDMGYMDKRNCLHISGRKKDMIAMENGDKIYCEETDCIFR